MYMDKVSPTRSLAKATGCSISALRQIVKKDKALTLVVVRALIKQHILGAMLV